MILKLVLRETRNHPRFAIFFITSVMLGLMGLSAIESFKAVVQSNLAGRSKELLGADLELSSRFPLTTEHVAMVKSRYSVLQVKRSSTVFSMTSFGGTSRLIQIRSQDQGYPFYGEMKLGSGQIYPSSSQALAANEIWIYPELATQIGVKVGDHVPLGKAKYRVVDIVVEDLQQSMQMGSIAPRVYMSPAGFKRGGFIQFGSTASYKVGFKLAASDYIDKDEKKLKNLKKSFDTSIKVSTPNSEKDQVGRLLAYLGDFLSLVSLVALFLSSVGIIYFYQAYLHQNKKNYEIMHAIGMTGKQLIQHALVNIILLSFLGTIMTLIVAQIFSHPLQSLAMKFLPMAIERHTLWQPIVLVLIVGLVSPFLLAAPMVFKMVGEIVKRGFNRWFILYWLAWPIFFTALSFYVAPSYRVSGGFLLGIVISLGILLPCMRGALGLIERYKSPNIEIHHALLKTSRTWRSTLCVFLTIFYCSLAFNIIPQLRENLEKEIEIDPQGTRPSLFLFDIQDDQLSELKEFSQRQGWPLMNISPLVRGRLIAVNGEKFEVETKEQFTREGQQGARFRNRSMNLSYKVKLNKSEKLIAGRDFSGRYNDSTLKTPVEISLEQYFAQRLNLELGDELEFDVLGMPILGKVVNLRSIRWTSFVPNFFINFQDGVLNDAPKVFLATLGSLSDQAKNTVQVDLIKSFPNVSAVDVTRVIESVLEIMGTMSSTLVIASILSVLVGLMVIGFIVHHQMVSREKDIALEKMLGVLPDSLMRKMRFEFLGILFFAALGGILASLAMSYILSYYLFDGIWYFTLELPLLSFGIIMLVGIFLVEILGRKAVNKPAAILFRDAL